MKILAVLLALTLSGCAGLSTVVGSQETLYAAKPFEAGSQANAYRLAAKAAQSAYEMSLKGGGNPIVALVDAGIATANGVCRDWLAKVNAADLRWQTGSGNIGIVESAITGILGAAGASSGLVAGYGIGATALNAYTQSFHSNVLGMADYATQAKMLEVMQISAAELRSEAPHLTYPAAIDRLEGYSALCTVQAARAAARSSMSATTTRASPAGTLQSIAK